MEQEDGSGKFPSLAGQMKLSEVCDDIRLVLMSISVSQSSPATSSSFCRARPSRGLVFEAGEF